MIHFKYFLVFTSCFALLFICGNFAYANINADNSPSEKTITPGNPSEDPSGPERDLEVFRTYRYRYSVNYGRTWSEIMDTGDHGMWLGDDEEREHAWGPICDNYGTVVDNNGTLHIFTILPYINWQDNPQHRVNGLYDIQINTDGDIIYKMIYEQRGGLFQWADGGIDVNGDLYVIMTMNYDSDDGERAAILAFKSPDRGISWNESPIQLAINLNTEHLFPHITYHINDYLWILFQIYNEETERYDHYTLRANAGLNEIDEPVFTGASSDTYESYQLAATNPIDQDNLFGYVYFTVINNSDESTSIGYMRADDDEWNVFQYPSNSAYPSLMLYPDVNEGGTPWVFGTSGVPNLGEFNHNWYTYSWLGYGNDQFDPITTLDSLQYDGVRSVFSSTNGTYSSNGRIFVGSNIYGQVPSEGFSLNHSDDGGYSWSEPETMVSIFDDGFEGGTLTEAQIVAGPDDIVWMAFAGKLGETDLEPPEINNVEVNTFTSNEDWVISADVADELHDISSVRAKFSNLHPQDPNIDWAYAEPYLSRPAEDNFQTYYFSVPVDATVRLNLAEGDSVWFIIEAMDEINNLAMTWENLIINNVGWLGLNDQANVPTQLSLGSNYPNPFNSTTVIPFSVDKPMDVNLSVYNISGRLIQTLQTGLLNAGHHQVIWDGKDVSAGIYIVRMQTSANTFFSKMTLIK
ncbi:MAG: T9SS type A sorting domain-containing protein [Calditrichaeota bacterium]|nr:T9SS type A sorting domain-containing protein [Calditrichota bacterium]